MKVHGKTLVTHDPLDLHLINISFEYDYANYAWIIEVDCNYPEARLDGEIELKNHTVYFNTKKLVR
jgi:hypothetical protein